MDKKHTIAILGTGIMGFQMARRLCEANFKVNVWNRSSSKAKPLTAYGADLCSTPAEAVKNADMVISILADHLAATQVLIDQKTIAAMAPNTLLVEMATMTPEHIGRLAKAAAQEGKSFIDAPVSGGEEGAKNGTLSIMAGGSSADVNAATPLLTHLGRVTHVGQTGSGAVAKLCNQAIVGNTVVAVAEALNLAAQMGADPQAVHRALLGGFADSVILHEHGQRMLEDNFNPGGPAKYMQKTIQDICCIAAEKNIRLPLTSTSQKLYADLISHENGDLDLSAIITELRPKA